MKFGIFLSTAVVTGLAAFGTAQAASLSYDITPKVVIPVGYAGYGDLNVDGINDVLGAVNTDGTIATLAGVQGAVNGAGAISNQPTRGSVSFVLTDDNGYAINVGYEAEVGENAQVDYKGYWSSLADGTNASTNGTAAVLYNMNGANGPTGALAKKGSGGIFAVRTDLYDISRTPENKLSYAFAGRIYSWVEIFSGPELTATRGGFSTDAAKSESVFTPKAPNPVPLPAGLPLMALALGGLAVARRATR